MKEQSKHFRIEFTVGLFAILGALCFAYLAVNLGGIKILGSNSYEIHAGFDSISGVKEGSSIEIGGVQIGEVTEVVLNGTSAVATLSIYNGVPIRNDDIIAVRTKGIIGDRYLKVIPGASSTNVKAGETIESTESAVDLEEILGKLIHRME